MFQQRTDLEALGIAYEEVADPASATWVCGTASSFTLTSAASAGAAGVGGAAGRLTFTSADAVLIQASDVRRIRIKDIVKLGEEVRGRAAKTGWDKDWRIVTSVVIASRCTVLLSGSAGASIGLTAKASVLPDPSELLAGSVKVELDIGSVDELDIVQAQDVESVVAFRALRLTRSGKKLTDVGKSGRLAPESGPAFELVGWDDDEQSTEVG